MTVALWGLSGGIMLFASLFGFVFEGLTHQSTSHIPEHH